MARTIRVRKDDQVVVVAGRDAGKRGKVLSVDTDKGRVVVEKIRMIKRHTKPSQKNQQGGIMEFEAPITVSNVMVVCGGCGAPTRVGMRPLADGSKIRVCKRCGESVDKK
ncbi:MAG: 50S ribosomal protein L24 [Leptospirillia bacterium]